MDRRQFIKSCAATLMGGTAAIILGGAVRTKALVKDDIRDKMREAFKNTKFKPPCKGITDAQLGDLIKTTLKDFKPINPFEWDIK